ncbi:MAG: helix-turn-helix domain-containing protein [Planctomycetota bacterium]
MGVAYGTLLQRSLPARRPIQDRIVRHLPRGGALRSLLLAGELPVWRQALTAEDAVHVWWLLRGQGRWQSADGAQDIQVGDAGWRPAGESLRLQMDASSDPALWCLVAPASLAQALLEDLLPAHRLLRIGRPDYLLKRTLEWHERLREATDLGVVRCWARVQEILVDACERAVPGLADSRHPWLQELADSLARHPGRRTSLEQIARSQGISVTHLRRLFLEQLGETPQAYRIRRRIERAQALLLETGMSLEAVAGRLGYPDVASFGKQFKRHTGTSPAAWRRRA